jgi:hypothetical protein
VRERERKREKCEEEEEEEEEEKVLWIHLTLLKTWSVFFLCVFELESI